MRLAQHPWIEIGGPFREDGISFSQVEMDILREHVEVSKAHTRDVEDASNCVDTLLHMMPEEGWVGLGRTWWRGLWLTIERGILSFIVLRW